MKNLAGYFFFFLIISALLFHGGVHDYFIFAIFILTSLAVTATAKNTPLIKILCLPLLIILFMQLIPLPNSIHSLVSPYLANARNCLGITGGIFPLAADPQQTITGWMKLLTITGIILLSSVYFKDANPSKFFHTFLIIVFIESMYALIMFLSKGDSFLLFGRRLSQEFATGSFVNKNHFGLFVAAAIPIGIYFCAEQIMRLGKRIVIENKFHDLVIYTLITSILLTVLILSRSRGAFVSLVAGMVVLVYLLRPKIRTKHLKSIAILLVISAGILVWIKEPGVFKRIYDSGLNLAESRVGLWESSANLIREYPITGIGPGSFQKAHERYNNPNLPFTKFQHPHNEYLALIIDLGIPAGLIIIILLLKLLFIGYKNSSKGSNLDKVIFVVLVIMFINFFVDFNLNIPVNGIFFGIVAGYILSKSGIKPVAPYIFKISVVIVAVAFTSLFIFSHIENDKTKIGNHDYLLSPFDTEWMLLNAEKKWKNEDYEGAKQLFDCSYNVAPYDGNVFYNRSLFYLDMRRTKRNEKITEQLKKYDKKIHLSCAKFAHLLNAAPDIRKEEFMILFESVDTHSTLHYVKSALEIGRGDLVAAIIDIKKPDIFKDGHLLYHIGKLLSDFKVYSVMLYTFEEAKKYTDDPVADRFLSRSYAGLRDIETAINICKESLTRYKSAHVMLELASIYMEQGYTGEAVGILTEAHEKHPALNKIILRLAEAYNAHGMYNESLDAYALYLERTGDESVLDPLKKLLKTEEVQKRMSIPNIILQYAIHND